MGNCLDEKTSGSAYTIHSPPYFMLTLSFSQTFSKAFLSPPLLSAFKERFSSFLSFPQSQQETSPFFSEHTPTYFALVIPTSWPCQNCHLFFWGKPFQEVSGAWHQWHSGDCAACCPWMMAKIFAQLGNSQPNSIYMPCIPDCLIYASLDNGRGQKMWLIQISTQHLQWQRPAGPTGTEPKRNS